MIGSRVRGRLSEADGGAEVPGRQKPEQDQEQAPPNGGDEEELRPGKEGDEQGFSPPRPD